MPYVIKSSNGAYVKQSISGFELTNSLKLATQWKQKSGAESQMQHLIKNKNFGKKKLHVEHLFKSKGDFGWENAQVPVAEVEKANTEFCVVDKARDFVTYADKLLVKKSELITQLSDVDRELVDIEHTIEFSKLSASQGYKIYKKFQDARIRRRRIKDDITVIEALIPAVNPDRIEEVSKKLNSLEDRKYHPRSNVDCLSES